MDMPCTGPGGHSRIWRSPDATHIDLRGLEPPEPMVAILQMLDRGEVESVLIAHFDREPIFLYPELDDRGWTHEVIAQECGSCGDAVTVQIARYRP
jgi:hypothetical protein